MENDCFPLDVSAGKESVDLFFPLESFSSFPVGLFSRGHLESMLWVLADDCSNVFASALTAFSTVSSQEFRSLPWASNWARMKGLRPFRKYQIIISSFGVTAR